MRPVWKGHISFGLVLVPVTLYPAEQRADMSFHMIDSRNFARVRYERVNADTGEEVPWDQIVSGYEYADGNYVVLGKEELKQVAPKATQTVDVEGFVDVAEIDLMYFDKPYFLEPGKKGEKGYALLRDVLRDTGKAAIAKVVIRTRQYIAAMVPREDVLVLNLLRYKQELRSPEDLDLPGKAASVGVTKQEFAMARSLVMSMAMKWNPAKFHDEYRDSLMKWIDKRVASGNVHKVVEATSDEEESLAPINLMEALKKSMAKAGAAAPTPAKKTTARARKPAPKRSAG